MIQIAIPRIYTKYVQIKWHLSLSATYGTHGEANLVSHLSHLCSSFLLGFHQWMILGFGLWTILGTHIGVATYTLTCKSNTWNLLVRVRSYSFAVCTISNWFLAKYKGKIQTQFCLMQDCIDIDFLWEHMYYLQSPINIWYIIVIVSAQRLKAHVH